jgi:hypothetical protein
MTSELSAREKALRKIPLPYSLALRLRDAGVAADVVCQYVNVEQTALDGLYHIAEAKLLAAQVATSDRCHERHYQMLPAVWSDSRSRLGHTCTAVPRQRETAVPIY